MARHFRYSWSFHNDYFHTCKKKGHLSYILRQDSKIPEDKYNAVLGIVMARVFERFYNEELWRLKDKVHDHLLVGRDSVLQQEWDRVLKWNRVDWSVERWVHAESRRRPVGPKEVFDECKEFIALSLKAISQHKLLGTYARAEVPLETRMGKYILYGKVDLVLRRNDTGLTLLDGKSSKHREKYVHKDQLNFYALLYLLKFNKLPDRLMFHYYRFDGELATDEFPVDKLAIKRLRDEIVESLAAIERGEFDANPVAKHCQWCPYEEECEPRLAQRDANSAKRTKATKEKAKELGMEQGSVSVLDF